MKPTVKIYGYGWVGKAMAKLFPNSIVVDPILSHYYSSRDKVADVAFVCVPTPLKQGVLDTSIVAEVVEKAKEPLIIIRSTVMPGFCDQFSVDACQHNYKSDQRQPRRIVYQPEYLGETVNHPMSDQHARQFIILGGAPEDRRKAIELYMTVYNANIRIRQVTNYEAEIIKLSENRAILWKVAQHQELFDICERAGVDYYEIVQAVYGDDPRFNLWFSSVYPDRRGANSKCIPKDCYGFAAWAESVGYDPVLTRAILERNELYIKQSASNPCGVIAIAE